MRENGISGGPVGAGVSTLEERALDTAGVRTEDGNYTLSPLAVVRLYTKDRNKKIIAGLTEASRGTVYRHLSALWFRGIYT